MKVLVNCCLAALCFLASRCELKLEDLLKDRWVSEDGSTFHPEHELNLLPGVYARDNKAHIKKMLLSPRISMEEIPNIKSISSLRMYDRFYLADPNAKPLADFDGTLVYLFQFGDTGDKGKISFPAFLASLERSGAVKLLSMCMAVALGSECGRSLDEFMEASDLNKARKKIHERRIQTMLEYLSREEEPYSKDGKVYIGRYANSKFMLLHIFLVSYLNKREIDRFHTEIYCLLNEKLKKVYYIPLGGERYTRCERMLLESSCSIRDMENECHHPWHNSPSGDHILNLLCFMLYDDKNGRFSLVHLPSAKEKLRRFFEEHSGFHECKDEEEAWREVLASLDDPSIVYEHSNQSGGALNLLLVLHDLCGIECMDIGLTKEDIGRYLSYLLGKICCYEQNVEVSSMYTRMDSNGADGISNDFHIKFYSPGGSLLRISLHCGGESSLVVAACDCTRSLLESEVVGSLSDLVIRHMKYENSLPSVIRKAPHVTTDDFTFLFDKKFYMDTAEDFMLCILDSILLVKEEDMSDEVRRIWDRARRVVELHYGDCLNEIYTACRRHFITGEREVLDVIDVKCLEELAEEESCRNLISYIAENVDGNITGRVPKEGLDGMLRAIVFGAANLQALTHFVRNVLDGLPFKDELLAPLAGSCCLRDKELLRFVFREVDTAMLIRKNPRSLSFSNLFGDICIEMARRGDADSNTARRAYDWIFLAYCESRIHFSLRLLDHTYRRFADLDALYSYILKGVASGPSMDRPRFAFLMLRFLRQESLCIPCDVYRGLWVFCHGPREKQADFKEKAEQLASELREAGLLVEKDALNKDKTAPPAKKKTLDRTIADLGSRAELSKRLSDSTFKNNHKRLKKDSY
jgi:hypothetical protein